jgi:hypothetical protein
MPFGDGTGPRGMGPMTGRGAGLCAGFGQPGFANMLPWRRWFGFGRGRGPGRGYGRYGTFYGQPAVYSGYGRNFYRPPYTYPW